MRGRHRLTAVVPLALALALGVAGCGGSPEPPPLAEPSTSATPSASASPSAEPPVLPAAARKKTKAGAIAFSRHYVDLINQAQSTGNIGLLREVESAGCASCAQADAFIEDLYASGGSIQGGAFEVLSATATANPATKGWLVSMGVRFGPQVVDHPSPTPDQKPKGGRLPLNIQLAWVDGGWEVAEWTRGA